ncbi:MAG: hypothetical protein KKF46_02225 [Nanoarchaeota archaeon]|nr:hypothetical protein [Nanoarchaeota archaeon]MBU1321151.1 hypothetical protein [Nanoarchaeota archaeon]MBU1597905.1 hypothetical protein [Nanoarchaeota archaeon]MBU2441620.1 hypothetical protein [Nanoarchaeota archaeon]
MFTKRKKFIKILTPEDRLDITLEIDKKTIIKFALNYRALINNKWKEIYRVDNFHGFLHEQKFWKSPKPIPIKETLPINQIVEKYVNEITLKFQKYKELYREKNETN